MSADLRGFTYALEPLRTRQRWQLEALQVKLGAANRDIAEVAATLAQFSEQLRAQHAQASDAVTRRIDPALQRRTLYWLVQLREEIAQAQSRMDRLCEQRAGLRAEFLAKQNKLDVIERHRDESLADYSQTQQNRVGAAADGDWLARRPGAEHQEDRA